MITSIVTLLFTILLFTYCNAKVLKLSTGSVLGQYYSELKATAFLNIPYAVPPIGDRRFRYAEILTENWSGTLNGTQYGPACMSNTSITIAPQALISEDCLTANIFISDYCLNAPGGCAAFYYLHGGGYHHDAPNMYDQKILTDNFATRNVILIMIAYRMNTFGMFYLPGDDVYTGNYHISDFLVAIQWIHREAKNINIDVNRITMMGHSSGAEAASLLTLLDIFDPYYQRAIAMSGNASPRTLRNDTSLRGCKNIAVKVNCAAEADEFDRLSKERRSAIITCMKSLPAKAITDASRLLEDQDYKMPPSMPRIDGKLIKAGIQVLRSSRTPRDFLTGATSAEDATRILTGTPAENVFLFIFFVFARVFSIATQYALMFKTSLDLVDYYRGKTNTSRLIAARTVADKYLADYGERAIGNLSSDSLIITCFDDITAMRDRVRSSGDKYSTYLYSFDYEMTPGVGAVHAQDMDFVTGLDPKQYYAPKYQRLRNKYMTYFVNFAKTGVPDPTWTPFDRNNYYSIDRESTNKISYHDAAIRLFRQTVPGIVDGADEESRLNNIQK